ncbi:MAG TPA: hypothetical protein DD409_11270 [Bacteroidales bacterium]|jgi:hypothetical protein|nr:hypothetical protein [Bacteroidales bacterium]
MDGYYETLQVELIKLANKHFRTYRQAAYKDVKAYLQLSKGRLEDYARLVETGQLTETDRAFLAAGLEESAMLYALKETGRSSAALKRFISAMVELSLQLLLAYLLKQGWRK